MKQGMPPRLWIVLECLQCPRRNGCQGRTRRRLLQRRDSCVSLHVSVRVARQERARPSVGSKRYRNGLGRNDLSCAISALEGTLPTTPFNGFLMSLDRTLERSWLSSALTMFWPLCRLRLEGSIELQRDCHGIHPPNGSGITSTSSLRRSRILHLRISRSV